MKIQKKVYDDDKFMGNILLKIGLVYYNIGDYGKAMDYNSRALMISEALGDKAGIGFCCHFFGMMYYNKGDYNFIVRNNIKIL